MEIEYDEWLLWKESRRHVLDNPDGHRGKRGHPNMELSPFWAPQDLSPGDFLQQLESSEHLKWRISARCRSREGQPQGFLSGGEETGVGGAWGGRSRCAGCWAEGWLMLR